MFERRSAKRALASAAIAVLVAGSVVGAGASQEQAPTDDQTREALRRVVESERGAHAFYLRVVERHGKVRPFVAVVDAGMHREKGLADLCRKYGVDVPRPSASSQSRPVPDSVQDTCRAAVELERQTIAMYDEVIPTVSITEVRERLTRMRSASADHRLHMFERCAAQTDEQMSANAPPQRCESCGMVGCGCSEPAPPSASTTDAAQPKQHGCGCMRQAQ
jgi:hypothetical protein